jgi:hypothetical protein
MVLRFGHRQRVFGNRMLRKMSGAKRADVRGRLIKIAK